MDSKLIKPLPKYILNKIQKLDKARCPDQKGTRMYSYLTTIKKELVKITVAVKNYKKQWHYKQVAVHSVKSDKCLVKDIEYNYFGYGYRVGWYAEGLTKYCKWYEDGNWSDADCKYYNPATTIINPEYINKFPEYKYSAFDHYKGWCVIEYLKLYEKYPQVEYLLKLGLFKIHDSITVLKRIVKDKKFCKWLIANKNEIASGFYYISTIMLAYKTGKSFEQIQEFERKKKQFCRDSDLKPLRELFKGIDSRSGSGLERFFLYIENQNTDYRSYLDYLNACRYLGLDMALDKNRFPHDFKRWHNIRIDEYNSAKAQADEKEKAELYKQFADIAKKYMALQNCNKDGFAIFIATNPKDLVREGEILNHCVGRMNYDQKMIRQESLIFFVRVIDKPDVPFVTVEYSLEKRKILQCYGDNGTKPDDTVLTFVNKVWLPYANRKIKKLTA